MLYFSDLPVIVNGSGVVVESFSLSHQSPMEIVQGLGYRGKNMHSVNGSMQTNLQLNYYPQLSYEPFYNLVNHYKTANSALSFNVRLADISGAFYLESFNYKILPNDVVKATVSLTSFEPTERNLLGPAYPFVKNDFAYGIFSYATLREEFNNRVFEFDYNFRANLQPVYRIGTGVPMQVAYLGAEENFVFVHEFWKHPTVTGLLYDSEDVTSITLKGTGNSTFVFPVEECIVKSLDLNGAIQDVSRVATSVSRIY